MRWRRDVILTPRPEFIKVLLSCANYGFSYLNLARITKFKYERNKENEKDSGRSTPFADHLGEKDIHFREV